MDLIGRLLLPCVFHSYRSLSDGEYKLTIETFIFLGFKGDSYELKGTADSTEGLASKSVSLVYLLLKVQRAIDVTLSAASASASH